MRPVSRRALIIAAPFAVLVTLLLSLVALSVLVKTTVFVAVQSRPLAATKEVRFDVGGSEASQTFEAFSVVCSRDRDPHSLAGRGLVSGPQLVGCGSDAERALAYSEASLNALFLPLLTELLAPSESLLNESVYADVLEVASRTSETNSARVIVQARAVAVPILPQAEQLGRTQTVDELKAFFEDIPAVLQVDVGNSLDFWPFLAPRTQNLTLELDIR